MLAPAFIHTATLTVSLVRPAVPSMLFPTVVLFILATFGLALRTNRTIDDEYGDEESGVQPSYSPSTDAWTQGSRCPACGVNVDNVNLSQVYNGTWHDGTYRPGLEPLTITVTFTGVAVYVYNIVVNNLSPTITFTNISFYLDGEYVRQYIHAADDSSTVQCNTLVFEDSNLSNTQHTLLMTAAGTDISLILFDYLIYTIDDTSPPVLPSSSAGVTTASSVDTSKTQSSAHSVTSKAPSGTLSKPRAPSETLAPTSNGDVPTSSLSMSTATASPTSSIAAQRGSGLPVGTIAGMVLGCIGLVVLACVAFWLRRRLGKQTTLRIGPSSVRELRNEDFDGLPGASSKPSSPLGVYRGGHRPSETIAMLGLASGAFGTLGASEYDLDSDRTLVMRHSTTTGRRSHYQKHSTSGRNGSGVRSRTDDGTLTDERTLVDR